jgi:hypothetical protein
VAGYGADSQTKTIVAGAANSQNLTLPPTILTGDVRDRDTNQIIAGATVTVTDSLGHVYTTTTDANGVYTFTSTVANPLAAGGATVEADSVTGYGSDSQVMTIAPGTTNPQNLTLPPVFDNVLDFGDLPAPYKTLLADDGPRHSIVPGAPYLGAVAPDAETDGQPNATATGDDTHGVRDEEGVARTSGKGRTDGGWSNGTVASGQGGAVSLTISAAQACLGGFMDFNASGALSAVTLRDASGAAISQPIAAGAHTFYFDVPAGTFTGSGGNLTIYSLFRVTSPVNGSCASSTAHSATGAAADGEVESFAWRFTPTAVTLVAFTAHAEGAAVTLAWETASEADVVGFHLYRATHAAGPYARITADLLPALGDGMTGAAYRYVDTPGFGAFYYQLADVGAAGGGAQHGPVGVQVVPPHRLCLPILTR